MPCPCAVDSLVLVKNVESDDAVQALTQTLVEANQVGVVDGRKDLIAHVVPEAVKGASGSIDRLREVIIDAPELIFDYGVERPALCGFAQRHEELLLVFLLEHRASK